MSKLDKYLKEVKQRCEAATEGPWEDHNWDVMEKPHVVARTLWDGKSHCDGSFDIPCTKGNAAFVAHARQDVEALRNMVQQLLAERAHLAKYIVELTGNPVPVWKVENLIPKEMRDEC